MSTRVDLHIHTNYSDGSWSPEEVIENIKKTDIKVFATADHDDIQALPVMEKLAKKENLEYVKALEVSTKAFGLEYHILAYDINTEDKALNEMLERTIKIRADREIKVVELAKERNKDKALDIDEFIEYRKNAGKGIIASIQYLMDKNVISEVSEYNAIKEDVKLSPDEDLPPANEAIAVLKNSGAAVVLAHPSYYFQGSTMTLRQLDYFREIGIDGIECYCAYNPLKEQSLFYLQYCKEYDLAVSGGSDCHGTRYNRPLGFPKITMDKINILEKTRNYQHLQDVKIFD